MDEMGLGDKLEKVIEKTIPKLSKKVKSKNCGCEKRKIFLNNIGAIFSSPHCKGK